MEDQKMKVLYDEHKKLIHKEVWQACRNFPHLSRNEILSEAHEIFCHCYKKWEIEKRVKFSTYLTQALRKCLLPSHWSGSQSVFDNDGISPENVGVNGMCGPERLVRLKQALSSMKPLAVEIVNLVFTWPAELESTTKQGLRNYVRKNLGIGDAQTITEAFFEIRQTLEEV